MPLDTTPVIETSGVDRWWRRPFADYSQQNLEEARRRLSDADVSFEHVDVTNPDAVNGLAERLGTIDILINNAGIGRQTVAEDTTDAEWREVMDINLNGVFWCARAFGRRMIQRGSGSIANVGSMAGEIVVRPQKNVHHATPSLAAEWAPRGVRVNDVAPGFVETPMNAFALKQDIETTRMWLGNTPWVASGRRTRSRLSCCSWLLTLRA